MKTRLLTSAVGIPLLFLVLYLYFTPVFDVVLLAACLIGYFEAFRAFGQKNTVGLFVAVGVLTAVSFLGTAFKIPGFASAAEMEMSRRVLFFALVAVLIVFTLRRFQQVEIAKVAGALLLCALLYFCFGTVVFLKAQLPFEKYGYLGAFVLVLSLAYAWGGDTFAYFTGRAFGKRKLCPNISPNKTVAGAIGAIFGSIVFGVLFLWLYQLLMPTLQPDAVLEIPGWIYVAVAIAAIPASLLGMGGDLFASCVKRQVGIKDYGSILPGQGGILDRFDSAIPVLGFVAGCVYVYMLFSALA